MNTIEKILNILVRNMGKYASGSDIGGELGITRVMVSKAINKLKSDGYPIVSSTRLGHCLTGLPKEPDSHILNVLSGLSTVYYSQCPSTNLAARDLLEVDPDITVVAAGVQTHGRGRMDRSFVSDRGGAYFSVIYRGGDIQCYRAMLIPLAAGLAASNVFYRMGIENSLKYPNDVICDDRKVCGILTESLSDGDYLKWSVTGIGINVNNDLPEELKERATTLKEITGCEQNITKLICAISREFLTILEQKERVVEDYKKRCPMLGKDINVIEANRKYRAKALDIDSNGYLIISEADGKTSYAVGADLSYRNA